jgi:hypothetical protein
MTSLLHGARAGPIFGGTGGAQVKRCDSSAPRAYRLSELTYLCRGYLFGCIVESDAFDFVTNISTIENVCNVRQRDHHKAAAMCRQRSLDTLLHGEKRQWILRIYAVRIADRYADLPDTPQPFFDQTLMSYMKGLIASDEQSGGVLRIKRRSELPQSMFGRVLWCAMSGDAQVKPIGRDKHPISIFKPASFDTIDPDDEVCAKGGSRFRCRANKIGDDRATGFDYPITHPAHATRVLDTIFVSETKIARKISANCVGIEHDRVKQRGKCHRECRLTGAWKSHDQNFASHLIVSPVPCAKYCMLNDSRFVGK